MIQNTVLLVKHGAILEDMQDTMSAPLIPFVGCWKCVKLGREMGRIAKEFGHLAAPNHLRPSIYFFVHHWNMEHSTKSKKSRFIGIWKNLVKPHLH